MKKFLIFIFLLFISQSEAISQCAMCRATVSSNLSEGRGVIGTGLNFGILYLLVMPYILVGGLMWLWFRSGRKELRESLKLKERLKEVYGSS